MTRRPLIAAAISAVALTSAAGLAAAAPGPDPGFIRSLDSAGFTTPTQQQVADLAQTMLDPNLVEGENQTQTSGFTYFGQFLDHDLTLDTSPPPSAPVDPTTLVNSRTFAFDLDSVYGAPAPNVNQALLDGAGRFIVQEPNVNGVRDLPRSPSGAALIAEGRNDENQVVSQIHLAILKAHNRLIDAGLSFKDARQTLVDAYQDAILDDFLPHIVSSSTDPKMVRKMNPKKKGTPIEFSVAAYRFGHSMVRRAYALNEPAGGIVQVFNGTDADLHGGRQLGADRQIDWSEFFADLPNVDTNGRPINFPRKTDTLISSGLFQLPIPGAAASGSNVLAFRNMSRGVFYALPSGQAAAAELGLPVIPAAAIPAGPGFEQGTPLWYYILVESERLEGGLRLGPLGSTLVMAGFAAAVKNGDQLVKGKTNKAQRALIDGPDGQTTVSDLFVFAGVATR